MSGFNHYATLAAIHGVLSGDGALGDMIGGVFDFVPARTAYPYVVLGDVRSTDASTVAATIRRVELSLHVYSRARGRKEAGDIMARIHALLHDTTPAVEGGACVDMRVANSELRLERDGLTYHGRMRVTAIVQGEDMP